MIRYCSGNLDFCHHILTFDASDPNLHVTVINQKHITGMTVAWQSLESRGDDAGIPRYITGGNGEILPQKESFNTVDERPQANLGTL